MVYFIYFVLEFLIKLLNQTTYFNFTVKQKNIKIQIFPFKQLFKNIFVFVLLITVLVSVYNKLDMAAYFRDEKSNFIEKNYVDSTKVNIEAPEKKQNLIHIYVESLETTFLSTENGGNFKNSVIPKLEKISLDNLNFSNNDKIGGGFMNMGTHYTVAGMVAQTSGVPLKIPLYDSNAYSHYDSFLPGVYSLGEILNDNGYHNYFILGSAAVFGGRKDYFSYHGDYTIYDYFYAIEKKWIKSDYKKWWGYEDSKLFKFAKNELITISRKDEPFNFTILTANTHFIDGYVDKLCETPYEEKYLNAYYCSDSEIGDFIDWLKEQDFYDNTTIVITGDHLTMQANIVDMFDTNKYERRVFNVFINSKKEPIKNKNRDFNSFDIYPTTLAALGFKIEGDRLGLGTNLFSDKKTLTEEKGNKYIEKELKMKSTFYNDVLLGSTYKEMILDNKPKSTDS